MTESDWEAIEDRSVNLWVGDYEVGLWCPTCLLSTGYRFPIQRDPAEPPDMWMYGCTEDEGHRRAVADHADPS